VETTVLIAKNITSARRVTAVMELLPLITDFPLVARHAQPIAQAALRLIHVKSALMALNLMLTPVHVQLQIKLWPITVIAEQLSMMVAIALMRQRPRMAAVILVVSAALIQEVSVLTTITTSVLILIIVITVLVKVSVELVLMATTKLQVIPGEHVLQCQMDGTQNYAQSILYTTTYVIVAVAEWILSVSNTKQIHVSYLMTAVCFAMQMVLVQPVKLMDVTIATTAMIPTLATSAHLDMMQMMRELAPSVR
jgi:hypothetical protein